MNIRLNKNLIALGLSFFCCTVVALTISQYGIAWDESPYLLSGRSYVQWLLEPSLHTIDKYWSVNHEHPPLVKILGGITEYLFSEKFSFLDKISAFRLSALISVFFLTYALFSFSAELYGIGIGLVVTLFFFFLPRVFFQSHLAALDYPLTAFWFLVIYVYWKGMEKGWKWTIIAVILLGFALLIKLTALFIYVPLTVCWLIFHRESSKSELEGKKDASTKNPDHPVLKLVSVFLVPPAIFVIFWPWLWKNSFERLSQYFMFHLHHFKIPVFYLGEQYLVAPWHYPLVFVSITVPLIVLVPFLLGISKTNSIGNGKINAFILFNAFFPILIVSLPWIPKYDGVRLFLPSFPFLCMVSGLGLKFLFQKIKGKRFVSVFVGGYLLLFGISLYASVIKMHPYQSSYFNELVGGINGASEKGFEHDYWGSAYLDTLEWLNRNSTNSFWLCMAAIDPKVYFPFAIYKDMELLKEKVRFTSKDRADYAILLIRQGFFDKEMWEYYLDEYPVFTVKKSNSLLVGIYRIKKAK
ncbi:MAG: glycosyltransferase family 39 protein [Deltaproteobacteria bacterium]|nr:glycosyltransferase family 39 protein [Deltaproteobacteria bacterium]